MCHDYSAHYAAVDTCLSVSWQMSGKLDDMRSCVCVWFACAVEYASTGPGGGSGTGSGGQDAAAGGAGGNAGAAAAKQEQEPPPPPTFGECLHCSSESTMLVYREQIGSWVAVAAGLKERRCRS